MTPAAAIDHRTLYRLPWSSSDNVIAWLEPTAKCNLACDGCYRENVDNHKPLSTVKEELDVFGRYRTFDGVSIAGGDPLLHPDVVSIVAEVARRGWKPVLNTNGLALKADLLQELKAAGLVGLTFHVDSKQGRPGWKKKDEVGLNALRLHLAETVASVGGLSCAFNSTVYEDTLEQVPELVQWAGEHIDKVHAMVFIAYRAALTDGPFDFYHGGNKLTQPARYVLDKAVHRTDITSREVAAVIRERFPDFAPSAYLGGTERPDSLKWLLSGRVGTPGRVFGYVGPRTMELVQTAHHLWTGRYLAYAPPKVTAMGRSMLALSAIDPGLRSALGSYLTHLSQHPLDARKPLHFQSLMIIQPIDLLEDGRQNMCDACPDITVHDGKLVWSCRLDEMQKVGGFLHTVPKAEPAATPQQERAVAALRS